MLTSRTHLRVLCLLIWVIDGIGASVGTQDYHLAQENNHQPFETIPDDQKPINPNPHTIPVLLDALDVLQNEYFEVWQGIWPNAIDWTSAVMGTYLSGTLSTLSATFETLPSCEREDNTINKYFSQLVAFYFGQDAFALRQQAYDDMLWVVLGWLESIKFINAHSERHYSNGSETEWYGKQWIPAFAHRARLFWELASQGWDTALCDGGMIWNPYLVPYKNAITNELFIAASISMYLHFPGDSNTSPFKFSTLGGYSQGLKTVIEEVLPAHDSRFLVAAIEGYKWLKSSNMTDRKGLYVDGFHISGWSRDRKINNTKCDKRNEMVYTYNQGVLLTGQRGLYEATGARSYIEEGHELIANVVAATGWNLENNSAPKEDQNKLRKWHGLGRSGLLEEACDSGACCSQDGQTFKGIFFHHLTTFCQSLPPPNDMLSNRGNLRNSLNDLDQIRFLHGNKCKTYGKWIKHNALAAVSTRDDNGRFGMWWGAPAKHDDIPISNVVLPDNAVDYRNEDLPAKWKEEVRSRSGTKQHMARPTSSEIVGQDLNARGRGRTVETQGGGLSVLRAMWELVDKEQ